MQKRMRLVHADCNPRFVLGVIALGAVVVSACSGTPARTPLATTEITTFNGTPVVVGTRCEVYYADEVVALVHADNVDDITSWGRDFNIKVLPLATPAVGDLTPLRLTVPTVRSST